MTSTNDSSNEGPLTPVDLVSRLAALEGRLSTMAAIEQAKGALMVTYGISADAAFSLLQFHSQTRNIKIRSIAAELTKLMHSQPTTTDAIIRFDHLLDEVARRLQPPPPDPARRLQQPPAENSNARSKDLDHSLIAGAAAPPGVTIAGNAPDLPLVYANDAFADITGYPIDEVLGRNCRFLQGAATDPRDVSTLSRALRTGQDVTLVMRNYRRDGAPFWNEVSISPIRDRADQITHYIGTQLDITDRIDHTRSPR